MMIMVMPVTLYRLLCVWRSSNAECPWRGGNRLCVVLYDTVKYGRHYGRSKADECPAFYVVRKQTDALRKKNENLRTREIHEKSESLHGSDLIGSSSLRLKGFVNQDLNTN